MGLVGWAEVHDSAAEVTLDSETGTRSSQVVGTEVEDMMLEEAVMAEVVLAAWEGGMRAGIEEAYALNCCRP